MFNLTQGTLATTGVKQRGQRCFSSNGRISTTVCCCFCSAAVKVVTLLMLPGTETSLSPRMAEAVLCRCWEEIDYIGKGSSENFCSHVNNSSV